MDCELGFNFNFNKNHPGLSIGGKSIPWKNAGKCLRRNQWKTFHKFRAIYQSSLNNNNGAEMQDEAEARR